METNRKDLHYRVMLLKKALDENKIVVAEHLVSNFQQSLSKIEFAEDGLVVPETVDGRIIAMSLMLVDQDNNTKANAPLSLNDSLPKKLELDLEKISKFNSEDDYLELLVEFSKEIGIIIILLSSILKVENNQARKMNRNEAILAGLLFRISKLNNSLFHQVCEHRTDLLLILVRCIFETIVNLKFLIQNHSEENFNNYVKYSLKTEKRFLNFINSKINTRGNEVGIETSMKNSIEKSFDISEFKPEDINEKDKTQYWSKNLRAKAEDVGMEEFYITHISIPSHSIHGNWQDLITNHLIKEEDGYSLQFMLIPMKANIIIGTELLIADISKFYTETQLPDGEDKEILFTRINDFMESMFKINEFYNKFRFSS